MIRKATGPHGQSCCQAEHVKANCFSRCRFHCARTSPGLIRSRAKTLSSNAPDLLQSDCHAHTRPKETILLGSRCVVKTNQDGLSLHGTVWKRTRYGSLSDHPSHIMHSRPAAKSERRIPKAAHHCVAVYSHTTGAQNQTPWLEVTSAIKSRPYITDIEISPRVKKTDRGRKRVYIPVTLLHHLPT